MTKNEFIKQKIEEFNEIYHESDDDVYLIADTVERLLEEAWEKGKLVGAEEYFVLIDREIEDGCGHEESLRNFKPITMDIFIEPNPDQANWKEEFKTLILDIGLKQKPYTKRYPLGQLEERVIPFISSTINKKLETIKQEIDGNRIKMETIYSTNKDIQTGMELVAKEHNKIIDDLLAIIERNKE